MTHKHDVDDDDVDDEDDEVDDDDVMLVVGCLIFIFYSSGTMHSRHPDSSISTMHTLYIHRHTIHK